MYDDAVAWAEATLGSAISDVAHLPGGLTSTMLALTDSTGARSVLRLMTEEPWRTFGQELTHREHVAQLELAATPLPAPLTLALDADGDATGVSAHLMTRLTGEPTVTVDGLALRAMSEMLATIHDVRDSTRWHDCGSPTPCRSPTLATLGSTGCSPVDGAARWCIVSEPPMMQS